MPGTRHEIMIIAGEASADRYGAALVRQLQARHPGDRLCFWGAGGDAMQAAGVELLAHVNDLGHIGPREAFTGLRLYCRLFRQLGQRAASRRPTVAILLDFPDFNLRLAKKMKRAGIKVVYYISPQVWAWRGGRVRIIRRYVDRMLVILPFEENYYRARGVNAEFVGHPLMEDFHPRTDSGALRAEHGLDPARRTVALLPGSRRREIAYILPVMLRAALLTAAKTPVQFLISSAGAIAETHIREIMQTELGASPLASHFRVSRQSSRDLLASADFALVKSGTSTLEAALTGVPFLITYRISPLSWRIGTLLIRTPAKGLPNLLAGRRIVPELFQNEATPDNLARVTLDYLNNSEKRAAMRAELGKIRTLLGSRRASESAAAVVDGYLQD